MCKEYIKIVNWSTMTDFTSTNSEILERIACFLDIYENASDKYSAEEVTISFKAAQFVENVIKEIENRSLLTQFMTCLNAWLNSKNKTLIYSSEFYKIACDHLLLKYFCNKNKVDLAIKLYTSCCNQERFQLVLEKAFRRAALYAPILNYVTENKEKIDLVKLKSRLMLSEWKREINCGRKSQVLNSIKNMLNGYSVQTQLPYLIKILISNESTLEDNNLKTFICEEILIKMDDRSILSKEFWLTITRLNKNELLDVCIRFKKFLEKFINFLIYCGCMMDRKLQKLKIKWITNSQSICPEISFENLTSILTNLVHFNNEISNYVELRISDCKKNGDTLIWNEISNILF